MIIWHNNRCSKSRQTLALIEKSGVEVKVRDYLGDAPSKEEIKEVLQKLNIGAQELIRKGEAVYKENFKGKDLNEEQWIEAMVAYPKLIERPIVINGSKAVIGRPRRMFWNC